MDNVGYLTVMMAVMHGRHWLHFEWFLISINIFCRCHYYVHNIQVLQNVYLIITGTKTWSWTAIINSTFSRKSLPTFSHVFTALLLKSGFSRSCIFTDSGMFGNHTFIGSHQHTQASSGHVATMDRVVICILIWLDLNLSGMRTSS